MIARAALPLVALALAAAAAAPQKRAAEVRLSAARGALELVSSRAGEAAFAAANMKPGDSVTGTVAVTNRGTSSARLFLRSSPPHGGGLGRVLHARIAEGSRTFAAAPLADVAGCHDLGLLGPGATRTFRLTAAWPASADDNAFAGSSVTVDETWLANEDGAACVAGEPHVADGSGRPAEPRIAVSHRHVALVGRRARLRLRCIGGSGWCAGSLRLRARTSLVSRAAAPARAGFAIPAGRSRTLYARVPRASLAQLRRRRKAIALALVEPARDGEPRIARLVTLVREPAFRKP